MLNEIKAKAKELLKTKQVDLIIGYKRAADGVSAMPAFIGKEEDVDKLVWDAYCVYNLSNYLKDFSCPGGAKKTGIVAKGCDIKSIIVLLQENQLKREDVFIIGVECSGVIEGKKSGFDKEIIEDIRFDRKCRICKTAVPSFCDILISQKEQKSKGPKSKEDPYENVRKLETKSVQEKFKFWQEEFSKCIRCYACRQVCPMCYCPRCTADQTMPSWFSSAPALEGNFTWNVMRAVHLAGRCINCGECERVCPAGIPLRDINNKIEKDVKELFKYEAGSDVEQKPLFSHFDENDPEDFIR